MLLKIKLFSYISIISGIVFLLPIFFLGLLVPDYSITRDAISLLGAEGSKLGLVANLLTVGTLGIALLSFGIALLVKYRERYLRISSYLFILSGLVTFLLLFYTCDSTCDPGTMTTIRHGYAVLVSTSLSLLGLTVLGLGLRKHKYFDITWVLISLLVAVSLGFLILITFTDLIFTDYFGIMQRVTLTIPVLFIFAMLRKIGE